VQGALVAAAHGALLHVRQSLGGHLPISEGERVCVCERENMYVRVCVCVRVYVYVEELILAAVTTYARARTHVRTHTHAHTCASRTLTCKSNCRANRTPLSSLIGSSCIDQ
jgi:hypothetical protein